MSAARARRFLVSGRVQGVGFRWFVMHAAERLGVAGWTRNLEDGRVEILGVGTEESLEALRLKLLEGPPAARVDDVSGAEAEAEPGLSGFHVRR